MAAVDDVLQLVVRGSYLSQLWTNVFHYRVTTVGTIQNSAAALNSGFTATVLPLMRALSNTGCSYDDIYTVNLGTPTEMDTFSLLLTGTIADPATSQLPSYLAIRFKYERTSALFRNGWKRFCGLVEAQTNGNTFSGSTANANALATALGQNLTSAGGPGWQFQPFIARRPIAYGTNPAGYPTNTVIFRGLATQNTRKP